LILKEHRAKLGLQLSEYRLLGYCEPNQYKLYKVHSRRTVFSCDIEFDERTPIAPLIEGETGNDLPDNAPLSLVSPELILPLSSALPTLPPSPEKLENAPYRLVNNVPSRSELIDIPLLVNLIPYKTQSI
jgi:hypothetical protein